MAIAKSKGMLKNESLGSQVSARTSSGRMKVNALAATRNLKRVAGVEGVCMKRAMIKCQNMDLSTCKRERVQSRAKASNRIIKGLQEELIRLRLSTIGEIDTECLKSREPKK